jgi:hypothetical protein
LCLHLNERPETAAWYVRILEGTLPYSMHVRYPSTHPVVKVESHISETNQSLFYPSLHCNPLKNSGSECWMLGMLSHTFQGFCYSGEVLGHQVVQILPCPYGAEVRDLSPLLSPLLKVAPVLPKQNTCNIRNTNLVQYALDR